MRLWQSKFRVFSIIVKLYSPVFKNNLIFVANLCYISMAFLFADLLHHVENIFAGRNNFALVNGDPPASIFFYQTGSRLPVECFVFSEIVIEITL